MFKELRASFVTKTEVPDAAIGTAVSRLRKIVELAKTVDRLRERGRLAVAQRDQ